MLSHREKIMALEAFIYKASRAIKKIVVELKRLCMFFDVKI